MDYTTIIVEKDKDKYIGKITFNRPEVMNGLNMVMITELGAALEDAEQDESVRVVVLTGKGKAFCAGADLKASDNERGTLAQQEAWFRWANQNTVNRLANLSKPVIAVLNGFTFAGGYEIMLACDLVIAAEDAIIGDRHLNVGAVGPGGSTQRTTWFLGPRKAKEVILLGKKMTGKEAEKIGLVNMAVPQEQLESAVYEMAAQLAKMSPVTMRLAKNLINRASQIDLHLSQEFEIMSAIVNATSEDYEEGMRAFTEKRSPIFKGR